MTPSAGSFGGEASATATTVGGFDEGDDVLDVAVAQELAPERSPTGWRRIAYTVLANRGLTITVAGLIIFAFFSLTTRQFLTANNLLHVVRHFSLIGSVAAGTTYVPVSA